MTLQAKFLNDPDELREFSNGELAVVSLPGVTVGRDVLHPGWRWSHDVKPLVGTESCQETHRMYVLSGRLHVQMDDGSEQDLDAGEAVVISPGHDAWVLGDNDFVAIDWSSAESYGKPNA